MVRHACATTVPLQPSTVYSQTNQLLEVRNSFRILIIVARSPTCLCVLPVHFENAWHRWATELAREGIMGMSLPVDPGPAGSDGPLLKDMALHSVARDMITRRQTFFPQVPSGSSAGRRLAHRSLDSLPRCRSLRVCAVRGLARQLWHTSGHWLVRYSHAPPLYCAAAHRPPTLQLFML